MSDEAIRGFEDTPEPTAPRVLVVDDEPAVRHFLSVILNRLGYTVEVAPGGAEAIQMARERSFDVVLTDLVMPRVDGLKVIQAVKESCPETEVVVITGYPSSETIVAATRAGAVDYLPKSPDPQHLAALLEKAVQIRDLRRKARERDLYLRMAQMDGLTELFNRPTFYGFLDREISRAKRGSRPLAVLLADVDGFGRYNKERGTLYGDQLLKGVAEAIRTSCRQYDILARTGADEFAILAPETPRDGGLCLARRIGGQVAARQPPHSPAKDKVTVSIGLACFPADAAESAPLMQQAEGALRAARHAGAGQVGTP